MKKLLLLLCFPVLVAGGLNAQLSFIDSQILYLSFDDDGDLGFNDEDIFVEEEEGVVGDDGLFGGSVYFDGDGSYMVFEPIDGWNHGMDFSLSWWMKSESDGNFFGILGWGTHSGDMMTNWYDDEPCVGGMFLSSEEGEAYWEISWIGGLWPGEEAPPAWNDGEWHHFVLTYNAETGDMFMYIDNILYYTAEEEPVFIADDLETINSEEGWSASIEDDNFMLGCVGQGWLDEEEEKFPEIMWYEGFIDDLRLFDAPLSEEDVNELNAYSPTGIDNIQTAKLFNIYPNPAGEIIQIQTSSRDLQVNIYNIAGQVVLSSFNETSINISSLSKGLYFVDVTMGGKREVRKLIVK